MGKKYLYAVFIFIPLLCFSQENIKEPITFKSYGVQLADEIEIANKYITIDDVKLVKLNSSSAKEYYQTSLSDPSKWDNANAVSIGFSPKSDNKYQVIIPPLKPNEFYKLDVKYYGTDNIFSILRMIHDEGNDNWNTQEKKWMKLFKILNLKHGDTMLTYRTTIADVVAYRRDLAGYNFSVALTAAQKSSLVNLTVARFPNLKFADVSSRGGSRDDAILAYAKVIKDTGSAQIGFNEAGKFENFFYCMDYEGVYNFYNKYFSVYLSDNTFNSKDYLQYFKKAAIKEQHIYADLNDATPNYLLFTRLEATQLKTVSFSTFPSSFTKAYTNAIVPDFGFIIYDGFRNNFSGGSLFIGANISLKPSNKDVPLQLSRLDFLQRIAIHTGVLTSPIDKGVGQREDLFQNTSLMLGASCKIFNHAYRINLGGIFYKQVDPITSVKTIAVAPYLGISIDIEIRKWLSGIFDDYKI